MIHEKIDWRSLSYDELIGLIKEAQLELSKRGTVTQCKNVFVEEGKNKEVIFITGYGV